MNKSCQFIWLSHPKYVFIDVLIALQVLERYEVRSSEKFADLDLIISY